jgi:O-antigen/teichoic acid export membrane protein
MGISIGYLSAYVSAFILLTFNLVTIFKKVKRKPSLNLYHACKNIFVASIPTWISQIIGLIGANLGTLVVFGSIGANQAGSYFIALTIFYAIGSIRGSIFGIAFPVLSAMDDERKRLVWKLIRMSLILSLPVSFTVIIYSDQVMGIIGPNYLNGSIPLKIFLLSIRSFTHMVNIGRF